VAAACDALAAARMAISLHIFCGSVIRIDGVRGVRQRQG